MNVKDMILGIAIIVLTIFVTFYGINTAFPKPSYDDFCGTVQPQKIIENQTTCESLNGTWIPQQIECIRAPCIQGYCDLYYTCSQQYDTLSKERSKKVFFLALPIGILIVALGAFVFGLEAVGAGLMGGGVGTLIYGAGAYWPYTQNWIRFLLSLVGLVLLIWLTYFWNKKMHKKGRKR